MEKINKDRAWIEISLQNLENNILEIKKLINKNCKIMAVVKANAYGHDMVIIAKKLNEIGITDFAVAALNEGIELRKNNIIGNILILGYTDFKDIDLVIKYDLIQTIVDYDYGLKINEILNDKEINEKIDVHIKVDTGMNRIGEKYSNIENIKKIFELNNLNVLGMFTHFSSADSLEKDDIDYSNKQIERFLYIINEMKKLGYNPGKIHMQSSYGILNYNELNFDYVRPGIIMYGVYCTTEHNARIEPNLKPVLELKARISCIKELDVNEPISYGRKYITNTNKKIATVTIGYADGYPRNLSGKNTKVLINNKYANIVGRICMDQLMIDITDIENIKVGDIVTLIGSSYEITAEEIAKKADTITDELLSRLGKRLPRIIK